MHISLPRSALYVTDWRIVLFRLMWRFNIIVSGRDVHKLNSPRIDERQRYRDPKPRVHITVCGWQLSRYSRVLHQVFVNVIPLSSLCYWTELPFVDRINHVRCSVPTDRFDKNAFMKFVRLCEDGIAQTGSTISTYAVHTTR